MPFPKPIIIQDWLTERVQDLRMKIKLEFNEIHLTSIPTSRDVFAGSTMLVK